MNEGSRRQTEGADTLCLGQCARIETITGQHDFFATSAGDRADHRRFREHTAFEKPAFEGSKPNVLIFRATGLFGALAALTLVDFDSHSRALTQGAVRRS